MHSERVRTALEDIRENIVLARRFVANLDEATFLEDAKTLYAVIRCLEIISEASRRLPADLKEQHPSVPWPSIAGAGNVYRHEYRGVLPKRIWGTVTNELVALEDAVEAEIAQD